MASMSITSGAAVAVSVDGPATDHLTSSGAVHLNDAELVVDVVGAPSIGSTLRLVDNLGAAPVSGTFAGLPEGATFGAGAAVFTISYRGGTGNDVTLTTRQLSYVPVVPARVIDTRPASQVGYAGPKPASWQLVEIDVGPEQGVPADARAVVLNVTAVDPEQDGWVTVWPCGSPRPNASNLNVRSGRTVANLVVAKAGDEATVCVAASTRAHVIADLQGWMPTTSGYEGRAPVRVLDTRAAAGQIGYFGPRPAAGHIVRLQLRPTVPAGTNAAVLNITATGGNDSGHVTIWPCDQPRPETSNLNVTAGSTTPNLAVATLAADGSVCAYTTTGLDLIADVQGWMTSPADYTAVTPRRVHDGRVPTAGSGRPPKFPPGAVASVLRTGDPVPPDGVAAVLNVTVTEPDGPGWLTVWPCGSPLPDTSNINFDRGQTIANVVVAGLGDGGAVCYSTSAPTYVVIDLQGWFRIR